MKQVTQRLRDGRVEVLDVPVPACEPNAVLVDVRASLLSAGTERAKVTTARRSLVGKARERPEQVRQVVDKARRDGIRETARAVRLRLDGPSRLGYSAAGVVLEVGSLVRGLAPGDRVACGGEDAVHAEVNLVPANLCVALPAGVDFAAGAFATVGSIALHGVRQADVRIGERVAVIGLGLVGHLTGQILRAAGCRVVGIDLDPELAAGARQRGCVDEAFVRADIDAERPPPGAGDCDAVIIAAATPSSDPVALAAALCRDRGRVVVVGDVGLEVSRAAFYEREIELRFSRSYGPGRYDPEYEARGLDYPIGYVRWTERRNMAAFVDLVAAGRVDVAALITEELPVERAAEAYDGLASSERSPLAVVLRYDQGATAPAAAPAGRSRPDSATPAVNVIGAGSFAQRIMIPGLQAAGLQLGVVASRTGLSAQDAAARFGFAAAVGPQEALADPGAGLVAIATRHASHAVLAEAALRAGKDVFVEKPPCLTGAELERLRQTRTETGGRIFVGFNRRHAPLAARLREHLRARSEPVQLIYRVNAEPLDEGHWLDDPADGGGRLLGEGCHFVDFACWLIGAAPARVSCLASAPAQGPLAAAREFTVAADFADGSAATVVYGTLGAPSAGKEYVEAHSGGRSGVLRDFTQLELVTGRRRRTTRGRAGDRGHRAQFEHLRAVLSGEAQPTGPDPLDTMAATLAARESAERGAAVAP